MVDAYEAAAELLVVFYLRDRGMDEHLFQAAVHAAHQRLLCGNVPILDAGLRRDIDMNARRTGIRTFAHMHVDAVPPRQKFG